MVSAEALRYYRPTSAPPDVPWGEGWGAVRSCWWEEAQVRDAESRESAGPMPQWMRTVIETVKEVIPREFVGQLEINVFRGGISHVNLKQSYRDERTTK